MILLCVTLKDSSSTLVTYIELNLFLNKKNAILDGCSTVDSKLDYDGIG